MEWKEIRSLNDKKKKDIKEMNDTQKLEYIINILQKDIDMFTDCSDTHGVNFTDEYNIRENDIEVFLEVMSNKKDVRGDKLTGLTQQKIANYFIHASVACDNIILTKEEAIKEIEHLFEDADNYYIDGNNSWVENENNITDKDRINKNINKIR